MLGLCFLLNWVGALTLHLLLKLLPLLWEPWFVLWGFSRGCSLSLKIYLPYDPTWNTVVMSALLLLVTTWICRISYRIRYVGPSLATSLEPIDLRRQVAISSLFYRHYFGRCSSGPFPLPYSRGRFIIYSNLLHDSSVAIPRCYKDVYVNSFFPRTVCL